MKIRLREINKHVSDGVDRDSENQKGAKEFSKSEAELVDVMDTFQHATSIIEKEIAKNLAFLQKEFDTGKTNSIRTALIRLKTSRSLAFSNQLLMMMKRITEQITDVSRGNTAAYVAIDQFLLEKIGTLKTVEDGHNT